MMNVPFNTLINGLPVEASYSEESIYEIFIPLLRKMTNMQKEKGRRILVFLAAPPGAGKTTLAHFLKKLSEETEGVEPITVIGMDGFHRYQDYLLTHEVMRDGRMIKMVEIKGAPVTFDLDLLAGRIEKVARGENCGWPEYDRTTHNPCEDAIKVDGDIVLLEGNYLLLKDEGWSRLKDYCDYSVKITADPEFLRRRLISRKELSGAAHDDAVKFVDFSDMPNARQVLEHSSEADLELKWNGTSLSAR